MPDPLQPAATPTAPAACALTAGAAGALATRFKALGDPTRLRLLSLIATHEAGEECVCDLAAPFRLTGPTIGHHLKMLREAGLVAADRRGTSICYRIVPDTLAELAQALTPM